MPWSPQELPPPFPQISQSAGSRHTDDGYKRTDIAIRWCRGAGRWYRCVERTDNTGHISRSTSGAICVPWTRHCGTADSSVPHAFQTWWSDLRYFIQTCWQLSHNMYCLLQHELSIFSSSVFWHQSKLSSPSGDTNEVQSQPIFSRVSLSCRLKFLATSLGQSKSRNRLSWLATLHISQLR